MKRLLLIIMLMICPAFAWGWVIGQPLPNRAGTIDHAIAQADGTAVVLDCVGIVKICGRQSPSYIVIADPWEGSGKIIVKYYPSASMRLGMPVEVSGTISTLYGQKVVINPTVKAYKNADNSIAYNNIGTKPDFTPFVWANGKTSAGILAGATEPTSPSITPLLSWASATYYANIADAKAQPDNTWVWLVNKKILSIGTDAYGKWFTLAADGSNDTIKVYSPDTVTTLDRCYNAQGLIGTHSGARTISTSTGPDADYWLCVPQVDIFDSGLIGWAKAQPDGATLALPQKIVSAVFPGYVYICEQNRIPGIKLVTSRVLSVGNILNISSATMATQNGERMLTNAKSTISVGNVAITPLGMNNRSVGGGDWVTGEDGSTNGQEGVSGGLGLNTVGLLVRVWGEITYIEPQRRWYVIDDGTGLSWLDGTTTRTGLKIGLGDSTNFLLLKDPLGTLYNVGDYVAGVNGISSITMIGDVAHRCIRQVGNFAKGGPNWFPINKINRAIQSR